MLVTCVQITTTNKTNNNKMKRNLTVILLFFMVGSVVAQPSERFFSKQDYIEMWKEEAIAQMVKYGIPASITLAQGMLESGNGNSELARYANNHFGIKCHNWDGPGIYKDDDKKDECFRKYTNAFESFEDHSKFLYNRKRYAFLFSLEITDYEGWAKGLRKAGYATNPKYARLLIDIIEENGLYQYDRMELLSAKKAPVQRIEIDNNELVLMPVKNNVHVKHSYLKSAYIIAENGDTYYKIAKEFDLPLWLLYQYNDCDETTKLRKGDRVYLLSKRGKTEEKYHIVKSGETLREIAQMEGVKLKKLYKKNKLDESSVLTIGQKIRLR